MANETVLKRYEGNPIIVPQQIRGVNSVFNSAVVPFQGKYAGVFRCDEQTREMTLHPGFSDDGIHWRPGRFPRARPVGRKLGPHHVFTLPGKGSLFAWVLFSPDGQWLAAFCQTEATFDLWRAPSWAEIEEAEKRQESGQSP